MLKRISSTRLNWRQLSSTAKKGKDSGSGSSAEKRPKKVSGDKVDIKAAIEFWQNFIETAEDAKSYKIDFTPEELANHERISKEFKRQSTIQNNQTKKDLATKIWLQQEAMRSMPPSLRAQAEIIDETPPPADRPWPVWMTPPIKGFNPREYMGSGDDEEEDEDDEDAVISTSPVKTATETATSS